jgi:hypothetical protein
MAGYLSASHWRLGMGGFKKAMIPLDFCKYSDSTDEFCSLFLKANLEFKCLWASVISSLIHIEPREQEHLE